jgi:hypothetical protein
MPTIPHSVGGVISIPASKVHPKGELLSTQALNGGQAEDVHDPLDDAVSVLEEMLPGLQAEREQVEARLREVSEREQRVRLGIAALTGPVKPATALGPANNAGRKPKIGQNPPSQKLQDDVYAAIARATEPPTIIEIADQLSVSRSAVDNTTRHLRAIERVRVLGVRRDGGKSAGNVFGVMP